MTVQGSSFIEPAQVLFGGQPATGVVVLDEASIAATTPPGALGAAAVKVVTAAGEGTLEEGYRYVRDLRVTRVTPLRIPEEGGVPLRIEGRGFDPATVILFDRRPLVGARLVSPELIEGWAPALSPGRPEIYAAAKDADFFAGDLLVVFATPELRSLAPGYGPVGGSVQTALGAGFDGLEHVVLTTTPVPRFEIRASDHLELTLPALPREGPYDLTVSSRDAEATLAGAFVAYDPSLPGQAILGVTPGRASTRGGEVVAVVGRGFTPGAAVTIGGLPAPASSLDLPRAILVSVPAGLSPGPKDVVVTMGATVLTAPSALQIDPDLSIQSVQPNSGPAAGGTAVTIRGAGFGPGVEVRIGDQVLTDLVIVSSDELTGRTVAGPHGAADVAVQLDARLAVLPKAFVFDEPFEVIRVDPTEGSVAGNTLVTVIGRGLTASATVGFGTGHSMNATVENGSVMSVRTPKSRRGTVDVRVSTARGPATLTGAYTFYDPRVVTGGAWGGPIRGSVNVAVLDYNMGHGMPGMVVQLGLDADPRFRGITDDDGLVTISEVDLLGPQTVTAGQNKMEFVTFAEINARNLTMFSSAYPSSPAPEDPVPPCPEQGQAPVIRGRIFKFKSALDPVTHPGWIPVARITYTDRNVLQPNPGQPAEQVDFVFADGQPYEIVVMRAGTVAVYATLGDFNQETQTFIPRRLGIARNVPAAPGQTVEGIDIGLDYELDRAFDVRLDDPPPQLPGPSINVVFPFLNLGSDGVIPFDASAVPDASTIRLANLPNLSGASFFYLAGSFTTSDAGGLGAPYSLIMARSDDDPTDGVDLGPFLRMPLDVTPKAGQVAPRGLFSWKQPGLRPDMTTVTVSDITFVSGCCCLDANTNGTCEANEEQQCGGGPAGFTRWSMFGPGGLLSYPLPMMPGGINAFDTPQVYTWVTQQALAPRFDYREWIYNQFSPFFWRSWAVSEESFLAKEQTD